MANRSVTIDRPPTSPAGGDGGGGGGWAWLVTARGLIEAELIRGCLETAGVAPVHLDGSDPSPGAWLFLAGNVNAPVRVYVPAILLDEARLALLERSAEDAASDGTPADAASAGEDRRWISSARWVWIVVTISIVVVLAWRVFASICQFRLAC